MTKLINRLTQRVTLLQRQLHLQDDGSYREEWQEQRTCWAHIKPLVSDTPRFDEGWGAQGTQPSLWRVTLRYRDAKFQRLRWRGRPYILVSQPLWDERRTCLIFTICEGA